jgi:hypothetical protein
MGGGEMGKTRIHTQYEVDGVKVPGVTTVLGLLAKPALIHWAWKLGCDGIDYKKERDRAADIGTIAHSMIMAHLKEEKFDDSEYARVDIEKAENALISYFEWEKQNDIEPIYIERKLESREYKFGGTPDLVAKMNGGLILVDYKTGKGIYDEMSYQLAAYKELVEEKENCSLVNCRILRIGRDESEGFEEKVFTDLNKEWFIFKHLLHIYNLRKEIKENDRASTRSKRK